MRPDLEAPLCSGCGKAAGLASKLTRFRRGDRLLPFEGWIWECPSGCTDPVDGSTPYRFSTFPLMEWEEKEAARAWEKRFGEPMPPPQRARWPGDQRTVRVPVMLTPAEVERLDRIRGELSRSEFLRQRLEEDNRKAS